MSNVSLITQVFLGVSGSPGDLSDFSVLFFLSSVVVSDLDSSKDANLIGALRLRVDALSFLMKLMLGIDLY